MNYYNYYIFTIIIFKKLIDQVIFFSLVINNYEYNNLLNIY